MRRFRRQPVFDIHSNAALAREPVQHIAVHGLVDLLVAAHEGTAVHEDHHRRAARSRRPMHVEPMPLMRPVGQLGQDLDPFGAAPPSAAAGTLP